MSRTSSHDRLNSLPLRRRDIQINARSARRWGGDANSASPRFSPSAVSPSGSRTGASSSSRVRRCSSSRRVARDATPTLAYFARSRACLPVMRSSAAPSYSVPSMMNFTRSPSAEGLGRAGGSVAELGEELLHRGLDVGQHLVALGEDLLAEVGVAGLVDPLPVAEDLVAEQLRGVVGLHHRLLPGGHLARVGLDDDLAALGLHGRDGRRDAPGDRLARSTGARPGGVLAGVIPGDDRPGLDAAILALGELHPALERTDLVR